MEICKTEVKEPYFLQTPLTDVNCYQTWISLRDSRSTGNRVSCLKTKQNNGIGIDNVLGKPVIIYTLEAYERHPAIDDIYIVCLQGGTKLLRPTQSNME